MYIEPRILKGFRDMLPDQETRRLHLIALLTKTFETFGFVPIDTPVLEYTEVLLGKGGGETDKQVYRFDDHGGRDVAMRFDLTVPFARYLAQHRHELYTPFRRYHVGKVFRGENTQRGRYREFVQCDMDIVGTSALSADLEIITLIDAAFGALGVSGVSIHIAHRGLFNRFLAHRGVSDQSETILRTVDKLRKIGEEETRRLLGEAVGDSADAILAFVSTRGDAPSVVAELERLSGGPSPESERMHAIVAATVELGLGERVVVDPSITRGLDYYTGIVFETFLAGRESIGSVCSGGRYDDLVSLYSKESLPGVGASVGLDRLIAALEEESPEVGAPASVLIVLQDEALVAHYHALAARLRTLGIATEVYPDAIKLARQFAFAERKRIPWALICGEEEHAQRVVNMRRLSDRSSHERISIEEAARLAGTELPS